MGFKWLDRRIYGQEQIIIKEAAIEVAMQKAGNPWFLYVSIGLLDLHDIVWSPTTAECNSAPGGRDH